MNLRQNETILNILNIKIFVHRRPLKTGKYNFIGHFNMHVQTHPRFHVGPFKVEIQ